MQMMKHSLFNYQFSKALQTIPIYINELKSLD